MSDTFAARGELEVRLEGIRELLNDLQNAKDGIADLEQVESKWNNKLKETKREIGAVDREAKKLSTTAKTVKTDLAPTDQARTAWDNLSDKIKRAELEYKGVARAAIAAGKAAPDAAGFLNQRGVNATDIARYQQGNKVDLLKSAGLGGQDLSALPRLRYALYDVATSAGIASAAITGVGVASATAFASMESSFTNVERTLDGVSVAGVQKLRDDLVGLTREIPLTFANISEIATLGNQLGIAAGDIASFTETTAKFSAVTGMTAEASAQAFGSLGELLNVGADEYENLGSAIALVGRRSVATEPEIVALTTRLAASATKAGFTAEEVVALSGALASLRVAPERAQGVMEIYFNRLNTALAQGGDRLNDFASVAGVTTGELRALVKTDPNAFFTRFVTGLGQMNQEAQTGALDRLGLDGIRAGEVFGRVSSNVEVFNSALADANQGWAEGTELGAQYAKVVDDLASRWQIFLNAVQEAGAAVGAVLAPFIEKALRVATDLLNKFAEFAKTPIGGVIVGLGAAVGGLIAVVAGLVSALALASASFLAIRTALGALRVDLGLTAGSTGLLSGAMTTLTGATGGASIALRVFRAALAATGIGAIVLLLIGLITDFNGTMMNVVDIMTWVSDSFLHFANPARNLFGLIFGIANAFGIFGDNLDGVTDQFVTAAQAIDGTANILGDQIDGIFSAIQSVFDWIATGVREFARGFTDAAAWVGGAINDIAGPALQGVVDLVNGAARVLDGFFSRFGAGFGSGTKIFDTAWTAQLDSLREGLRGAGSGASAFGNIASEVNRRVQQQKGYSDLNEKLGRIGGGPGGKGGTAGGAAKAIRTLVDYANDLSGVFKRAFDIRFGNQQGMDSITSGWRKIAEASADAAAEASKYRATLAELSADRQIKQYWLSVAENYGDQLRATKLRAELAELDLKQADAQKDLSKAQDKASKTLTGNSDAAIENRSTILDMVGSYQDLLKTYAANGATQDQLKAKAAQLKAEFIAQAVQMGYSRAEVQTYARSFDDMSMAINRVPRNITVTANINPALQALAEFEAKARASGSRAGGAFGGGFSGGAAASMPKTMPAPRVDLVKALAEGRLYGQVYRAGVINGIGYIKLGNKYLDSGQNPGISALGHKSGGYTGNGGVNEPAHFVHGREFVMSAPAVRTLGVNGMNYLHTMLKQGRVPTMGGGQGGGGGVVDLSAGSMQAFARVVAKELTFVLPGAQLAGSVGAHNVANGYRGGA